MSNNMDEIREVFFEECEELIEGLQDALGALSDNLAAPDAEAINVCFRAVHSIKGGAAAFGLDALVNFAHQYETTMDLLRSGTIVLDAELVRLLVRAADLLQDYVSAAHDGTSPPVDGDACLGDLAVYAGTGTEEDLGTFEFTPLAFSFDTAGEDWHVSFKPHADLYRLGNEPLFLLRALRDLGATEVRCITENVPTLADLTVISAGIGWHITLPATTAEADIREIFDFVDGLCDLEIGRGVPTPAIAAAVPDPVVTEPAPTTRTAPDNTPTVRVNLERIDRLVNLVGELVITQAMLSQSVSETGIQPNSSIMTGLDTLNLLTREIQKGVMMIRAQPVKPLFQRMARTAREASAQIGKNVVLQTEGDATEVDKTVLERLAEPLTHMIRNAVDHGIETADDRIVAGKSPVGTIRLTAQHRSGRLMIELSDDGAGINRKRVFDTAVARDLIASDAILTDHEIDSLLFSPGFSTARQVSALSGRGVGMDVVKSAIHAFGGRIAVHSEAGLGTRFTISLPLTLAVLDGMVVTIGDEVVVVPISSIIETTTLRPQNVNLIDHGGAVIQIRDSFVPLYDLYTELGYGERRNMPQSGTVLLTTMENDNRVALVVDAIVEQRQVVIKGLHDSYGHIPGISAATILGDGHVALILDPADLVQNALDTARGRDTNLSIAV